MPAPIVFRPKYGPWDTLLPQLFMQKIQHNYAVKEKELEIKQKDAALKEQREYKKTETLESEKRGTERTIATENRKAVEDKNKARGKNHQED